MQGNTSMYLPFKSVPREWRPRPRKAPASSRASPLSPAARETQLQAFDLYTDQRATQQFLDSVFDATGGVMDSVVGDLLEQLGTDLAVGAGAGSQKCSGLFAATSFYSTVLSRARRRHQQHLVAQPLLRAAAEVLGNSAWIMNPSTLASCMGLARPNLSNMPLVSQAEDGSFSMLGCPIVIDFFGALDRRRELPRRVRRSEPGYLIGQHKAPTILRDPFTDKPKVIFYGLGRFGGAPWDPNAVVLMKSNNA